MTLELTPEELERHTAARLGALKRELGDSVASEQVDAVGRRHLERLRRTATVTDFVPLFVYRFAREELLYADGDRFHDAA
jgi:hypothetical protein